MKKNLSWLFIILALGACGSEKNFSPNEDPGMQKANTVSIFESKDSQKRWMLNSKDVDFSDMQNAALDRPELILKENGQDSAKITATRGIFNYPKKTVTLKGKVKALSFTQNLVLETDYMYYDVDKDRVWTNAKTLVTRGGVRTTAKNGIETNSKLTKIEFKNQSTQLPQTVEEIKNPA